MFDLEPKEEEDCDLTLVDPSETMAPLANLDLWVLTLSVLPTQHHQSPKRKGTCYHRLSLITPLPLLPRPVSRLDLQQAL